VFVRLFRTIPPKPLSISILCLTRRRSLLLRRIFSQTTVLIFSPTQSLRGNNEVAFVANEDSSDLNYEAVLSSEDVSSESEDYVSDEDEEEFDSEDEEAFFANPDLSKCRTAGPNTWERLGCGRSNNRNNNNRNWNSNRNNNNRNWNSNNNCGDVSTLSRCDRSNGCEWVRGRCRRYEDALDSEDVSSESKDYVRDEDEEEFDSEDLASEDSADNDEDEEDTEDIDFNRRNNNNWNWNNRNNRNNWNNGNNRNNWNNSINRACNSMLQGCQQAKRNSGFGGINCQREYQRCIGNRVDLA